MDNQPKMPVHGARLAADARPHKKKSHIKLFAAVLGGVILVLASAFIVLNLLAGDKPRTDRYQAVFLNNNQVFFGKLKNVNGTYLKLEDAYYSKKQELPDNATKEQKAANSNNVSLVKVGSEVYGPENTLVIRAEQVLFWQDLTKDSKVAKAIENK